MRFVTSPVGSISHDNYALSVTAATKTLPASCVTVLIQNMDAGINALVSFDGGSTFKTISPGATLTLEVAPSLRTYKIKSASGTPNVECLYGVEI